MVKFTTESGFDVKLLKGKDFWEIYVKGMSGTYYKRGAVLIQKNDTPRKVWQRFVGKK